MGGDNSVQQPDEIDSGKPCNPPEEHAFSKIFKCDKMNCEQILCGKCVGERLANGQRFCLLCSLNKHQSASTDISGPISDDLGNQNGKPIGTWEQTVSVQRDKSTNNVIGWESLFAIIEKENKVQEAKLEQMKKLQKDFVERNKNFQASFTFQLKENGKYQVNSTSDKKTYEVTLVNKGDGRGELLGLPNKLGAFLFNFTDQEILEDPDDVLNVLITMYDSKGDGQRNLVNELPTPEDFQQQFSAVCKISETDPSKSYDILGKLGQGGFAKVFKVKRKSDGFICALKFVEPKNEKERKIILNEIGLMQMCHENSGILKVLEAYDYKQRLWIFVELMDDALTSLVQNLHKSYSENICKYVLKKTLEGLLYLHERNIIHRDIKSDNILMNLKGEVKLADFGYACQLTTEANARASKVGTVCWMAPELIRGERKYTTKVDIWSFGIFAMEMADGDPPYINETQQKVIFNIVKKSPPPIKSRWSDDFRDFVSKCLTKNPADRPTAQMLLKHPFLNAANTHQAEFVETIKGFIALKRQQQMFLN